MAATTSRYKTNMTDGRHLITFTPNHTDSLSLSLSSTFLPSFFFFLFSFCNFIDLTGMTSSREAPSPTKPRRERETRKEKKKKIHNNKTHTYTYLYLLIYAQRTHKAGRVGEGKRIGIACIATRRENTHTHTQKRDFYTHRAMATHPENAQNSPVGGHAREPVQENNAQPRTVNGLPVPVRVRAIDDQGYEFTKHALRFRGEDWDIVLNSKRDELRIAFTTEAAAATAEPESNIVNIRFFVDESGRLIVKFSVRHKAQTSGSAVQDRLATYPYKQ
ncbi:hypothetical protein C4B63_24g203 [Trypanosoma cruzi]|uniref:Flagellar attachment zone protein 1 conserved domain-containing protein n=1 Tax=Trypanosoma cruzi TaxID=5693 RepID=A0A2V2VF27_TRYCR|nr:hypothetical protein C4B63_24g203 [Trypanosoma cruzi]